MAKCEQDVGLLSAADIISFVEALPEFLAETKCPGCNSSDASTYQRVEDTSNVRFCSSCDRIFGIDDSMNPNDLRKLMEEGKLSFKMASPCVCGNDDVDAFIVDICQQSEKLLLKCLKCSITTDVPAEVIATDIDDMHEYFQGKNHCDDKPREDNGQTVACDSDDHDPHQRYQSFTCGCGNEETELFDKVFDKSGDCLVSVRCWICDSETKLWAIEDNDCLIECSKCGNNTEDLFETTFDVSGQISDIFCHACETHLQPMTSRRECQHVNNSESLEPPLFVSYKKTKVTSLETLKRGDHVAWERRGLYSHHGIVVAVLSDTELEVIHNTVADGGKAANGGKFCKIQRETVDVDLLKEKLYLCNYEPGECLEPDEVIARAESLLDVKNYNLLNSNCEHFATLCKTSRSFSAQVSKFVDVMRWLGSVVVKEAEDGALVAIGMTIQNHTRDKILRCSTTGAIRRFAGTGMSRGLKGLSVGLGVALNLAVEGVVFGVKTKGAHDEYKKGEISRKQFEAKRADAGCTSGVRFAFSSIGGVAGQLLIPVPFLGGLVGCTLGTIVGDFIGKPLGKRWANKLLEE